MRNVKRGWTLGLLLIVGCWDPSWPAVPPDQVDDPTRDGGLPPGDYTWFQDVRPVVQQYCGACHGSEPRFGATRSMVSYEDVMAYDLSGQPLHAQMAARLTATHRVMPPRSQPQLTPSQIDMIRAWSGKGARMGTPTADVTWHQDIEPIVREACQFCHQDPPRFSAPMPLVTFDDLHAFNAGGVPYYEAAAFRIQAPAGRMPPATHNRQLTPEEIQLITQWAESGAPEGEPPATPRDGGVRDAGPPDSGPGVPWANGGTGSPPIEDPDIRWIDTWAHARGDLTAPYQPDLGDTIYRCWSFYVETAPEADVEFVTWMEPILDNLSNMHHLMIFIDDSGLDARRETVGPFECEGFPYEADGVTYAEYIDGWFPGRGLTPFPDGIGIPLRTGYRLILQGHYDRIEAPIQDMSGIRLLVDRRPMTASATLWSGVIWPDQLIGDSMRSGECTLDRQTTIYRAFPHMHTYGRRIVADVRRAGTNNWQVLAEIPAWNFEDQPILDVPEALQVINPGDTIRTRCWWDTGTTPVRQGEGSFDEMCFTTFFAYPPVPDTGPTGRCVGG